MADIEKTYYTVAPQGRDICLACPLWECVHMPEARPEDVCPIDGARPQVDFDQRRYERLLKIEAAVERLETPTVKAVAGESGISKATLDSYCRRGYLRSELIFDAPGRYRRQRIIKQVIFQEA